ncbi:PTS system mannose/fructose/sorbose family transporter subunit IID [[Clostridium] innocuum]|uniref:PTS system mannose/fructose/sorbose family transporter subunit IID n=1 Tax=Clostridium innocuum TaxID=1522 RepID=UPI001F58C099|nr:PTS system mannose/fructose/sorbose family transporter subunit IID [[Clostridium] innocuum]MCI2986735.1 PTS system mannose/fructose/sorbose family transporter subunit IID [[Clostridium] innocuum]
MSETVDKKNLLTSKEVNRAWLLWLFNNQACYNYERMMGIGFLHAMTPAFRKLYKDNKDLRIEAMQRHTSFFNCEPCLGSSIVGLVMAMEEQKALGAELDNDAITSIKTGQMGPLSGIGDTLIQGVILPLLIAFAVDFAKGGNWVIPLVFSLVMAIIVFGISRFGFLLGYRKGSDAILSMLENGVIKRLISAASIMGCMVLGALVVNFVTMKCGISIPQAEGSFSMQEQLFDAILPSMLPLLLTLGCYKLLKAGKSSVLVMLVIIAIGVIGGLTGILSV